MVIKRPALFVLSLVFTLLAASSAWACACCVNKGYYEHARVKPGEYYTSLFGEMKLNGAAELYMTEGGFDEMKGLPDLANDEMDVPEFDVRTSFAGRTWNFTVGAGTRGKGSLTLLMPQLFTKHLVDFDGVDTGLGVNLYKTFTLTAPLSKATGIFRSANRGTTYSLVFLGRGNGCDNASDFTRWRLEINGPRAHYAFFGKLN